MSRALYREKEKGYREMLSSKNAIKPLRVLQWAVFAFCIIVSASTAAFDGDVRVDDDSPRFRYLPAIALDKDGNIYVVWKDEREGRWIWNIYFAKSTDGGATFGPNVKVGRCFGNSLPPSIAVDDNGHIYVAWYDEGWWIDDYDVYFSKSTDGGQTFSPRLRVDNGGTEAALGSSMAIHGSGGVYIAWTDDREVNGHIFLNRSTDGGATFGSVDVRVDHDIMGSSAVPSVAAYNSGDLYVTWQSFTGDSTFLCLAKSVDGGESFGPHVPVDDGLETPYCVDVKVNDRNNIYVVWYGGQLFDYTNIYCDKSTDDGESFGADVRVDDGDSTCGAPSLAVDGTGDVYVAWQDRRNDYGDIYFSMSADGGKTFYQNIRVDHQEWSSSRVSIAADDSGNVYVVWTQQTCDYCPSDAIYFTRFNAFTTCGGKGDVNLDETVNVLDVVLAIDIILETVDQTGYREWAADFNSDGVVNIIDVVLIVNSILNGGFNAVQ